jgi:UDP-N-acetylmuramate--alanine ligase
MKIHFIGIGGIGISALAQYYLAKGYEVQGSDLVSSEVSNKLEKSGIKINLGSHKKENISKDIDLVIYSPAVQKDNPEFEQAKNLNINTLSYPQALGELTKEYFTIAISGTHGKSTTSSMIALTLIKAGFDPTVIVGTKLKEFDDNNFRIGKSKYLVIEADEWQASFLNYHPNIIVLTNIEEEHLDYYKDLNHILDTYKKYIANLKDNGVLVVNEDDNNILKIVNNFKPYSLKQEEADRLRKILKIPGDHNIYDALACLETARSLDIPDEISFKALSEYRGSWRRFETKDIKLNNKSITLISDYAHHPTEIKATLKATRQKFPDKQIWCIFQPHQYQRTYYLFNDFVKVFSQPFVDKLIITDIFDVAGREKGEIKDKINSNKLVEEINKSWVKYLNKEEIKDYLENNLKGGEVVIIMGAGNVYKILDTSD